MATEAGRTIKRKRIKLPGGATVDIPVIYQITFSDAADRGQELRYTIDNTTDSDRTVHVASIIGHGEATDETGQGGESGDTTQCLQVERIDRFKLLDNAERSQETFPEPDNKTIQQPPDAPPYFTTHAKTHIIKYIKRNDDDSEDPNIWIKSELIDAISFGDASERGQETQFTLNNPPDNQDIDGLRFGTDSDEKPTISIDASVEEITSGVGFDSEGNGDPVRTDPFQNIVDFSGIVPVVFITWNFIPVLDFSNRTTTGMSLLTPAYPSPKSTADFSYTDAASATASSNPFIRPDGIVSNPPWILSIPNGGNDLHFIGGTSLNKSVPLFDGPFQVPGSSASAGITGTTVMVRTEPGGVLHPYDCFETIIDFIASRSGTFQYQGSVFVTAAYRKRS